MSQEAPLPQARGQIFPRMEGLGHHRVQRPESCFAKRTVVELDCRQRCSSTRERKMQTDQVHTKPLPLPLDRDGCRKLGPKWFVHGTLWDDTEQTPLGPSVKTHNPIPNKGQQFECSLLSRSTSKTNTTTTADWTFLDMCTKYQIDPFGKDVDLR